jgi:hypothetical protein
MTRAIATGRRSLHIAIRVHKPFSEPIAAPLAMQILR